MTRRRDGIDWGAMRQRMARSHIAEDFHLRLDTAHAHDLLARRAAHLAESPAPLAPPGDAVLVAELNCGRIGLPVAKVRNVLTLPRLIPVPGAAAGLAGMTMVGGEFWDVLDLEALTGAESAGEVAAHLVLLHHAVSRTGLRVRRAVAVMPAPPAVADARPWIAAIAADGLMIIDATALIEATILRWSGKT